MHEFLIEKLSNSYDDEKVSQIIDGLKCKRRTTFRVNYLKSTKKEVESVLKDKNIEYTVCDNNVYAYILNSDDTKTLEDLDIYKEGKIYLQSISSMLPVYVLDPKPSENILDMCAAPGSKTTLIQSLTNNKVYLTAVELHKDRFERLKFNVGLQGANVYLLNKNAIDLDDNLKFDKILLDAPCSGSGILDINDDKYEKYFTKELIDKCVKTQKKLITKASKLVKKGSVVVYSTCSLLKEENEEIVEFAKKNGFKVSNDYIKILPNDIYEGFFVTSLIKE